MGGARRIAARTGHPRRSGSPRTATSDRWQPEPLVHDDPVVLRAAGRSRSRTTSARLDRRMTDARLIERWLPIAALGEESVRERSSMPALPPTYYLHVWWARRPLVASRDDRKSKSLNSSH